MPAKKRVQSSRSSPGKARRKMKTKCPVPRSPTPPNDLPEATDGGQGTDGDAPPQATAGIDTPPQAPAGIDAPPQAPVGIDAPPQVPVGIDAPPQAPDGIDAPLQAPGGMDPPPQAPAGMEAPTQAPSADDDASQQNPADDTGPSQPTSGKDKGKGKSKGKAKAKGIPAAERHDNSLSQEQEEDIVEWMRENDAVWRRGHHMYKARKQLWAAKATNLGVSADHLEGWWKSMKDWFVRLMKRQSGQATKKLTDREKWILDRIAFYTPQLKSNEGENAPMKVIQRQEPRSQPPAESDSDSELPSHQPPQATQSPQPGQSSQQLDDLEGIETMAATQGRQESESRYSTTSSRRKRKRADTTEEEWMHELRDSIRANTSMMAQLVQQRPTDTGREPFITYLQDSLRSLPEEKYQLVRGKITAALHNIPPTATATTDRTSQSQSDPPQAAVQCQLQPPQQQPPPRQAPSMRQSPTPQPAFKQPHTSFMRQSPTPQSAFNQPHTSFMQQLPALQLALSQPEAPFMQQQPTQQHAFIQTQASYQQVQQQQTASTQSDSSFCPVPSNSTPPPQQTDSMVYTLMKPLREEDQEWDL